VLRDANPSKSKNSAIAVNFFISDLLSLVVGERAYIQNERKRENVPQHMREKRGKNGLADLASRTGIVPWYDNEPGTLQTGLIYGLIITSSVRFYRGILPKRLARKTRLERLLSQGTIHSPRTGLCPHTRFDVMPSYYIGSQAAL
jgi:hypothetical protein